MVIYRKCNQIPLKVFFRIMENNDYRLLIKYPILRKVLRYKLVQVWEKIIIEYGELDGNNQITDKFDSYKEAHQLAATFDIINAELYYLQYKYKREYIDDLAMMGFKVEIVDNIISLESLKKCRQMSRSILNDMDALKKDLGLVDENKKGKNVFEKIIAWLTEGFGPSEYDITVSQYLALKNRLNAKIKRENGKDRRKSSN